MTILRATIPNAPPGLRYSAGAFEGETLVRTLKSVEAYDVGQPLTIDWEDSLDDEGQTYVDAKGCLIKVVGNAITTRYAGIVGNTSLFTHGDKVHNAGHQIGGVIVLNGWAWAVVCYTEGDASAIVKWRVSNPHVRYRVRRRDSLSPCWIDTDGELIYINGIHTHYDGSFNTHHSITIVIRPTYSEGYDEDVMQSGSEPIYFDQPTQTYHTLTKLSSPPISDQAVWDQAEATTGFTVDHSFIGVAREKKNEVVIYNHDNVVLARLPFDRPRHIRFAAGGTRLWVSSGDSTLECYVLNANGTLGAKLGALAGLFDVVGTDVSPDGTRFVTIEGDRLNRPGSTATHRLRVWSTETYAQLEVHGNGDYATNVLVNPTKWRFINAKEFAKTPKGNAVPYVVFQDNDTVIIGDTAHYRNQFYSLSQRKVLDELCYVGYHYAARLVANKEEWQFINFCRYKLDYAKILATGEVRGNWTLEADYASFQLPEFDDPYNRALDITMFPNGKMYSFCQHQRPTDGSAPDFYLIRAEWSDTGIRYNTSERFKTGINLNRDYSMVRYRAVLANGVERDPGEVTAVHRLCQYRWNNAYDANGWPVYAPENIVWTLPPLKKGDPITAGGSPGRNTYTTNGIWGTFSSDTSFKSNNREDRYGTKDRGCEWHLGGVKTNGTDFLFKTAYSTARGIYYGNYPDGPEYDDSNGVRGNQGSFMYAVLNFIMYGVLGEFWKEAQLNIWKMFIWYGLMLVKWGAANRSDGRLEETAEYLTSNAKSGDFYPVPGTNTIVQVLNTEGFMAGSCLILIDNIDTIWEREVELVEVEPEPDPTLHLLGGLPLRETVPTGAGRLTRYPEVDTESFSVFSGIKELGKDFFDIEIAMHPALPGNVSSGQVTLDFSDAATGYWEILVYIRFLFDAFDDGPDTIQVRLLDQDGNQMLVLRRDQIGGQGTLIRRLLANNEQVVTYGLQEWHRYEYERFPTRIGVDEQGLYVKHDSLPRHYLPGPFEAAANLQAPAQLQVYADSPRGKEFGVNLTNPQFTSRTLIITPPDPVSDNLEIVDLADGDIIEFIATGALKAHLDAGGDLNIGVFYSDSDPDMLLGHWAKVRGVERSGPGTGFDEDTVVTGTGIVPTFDTTREVMKAMPLLVAAVDEKDTVTSFDNELGKLFIGTDKTNLSVDLNQPDADGARYGDQFMYRNENNEVTGDNRFLGNVLVNTQSVLSSSQLAANTAFVQALIGYSLSYTTAIVYRAGLPPYIWPAAPLFDPGNGAVIAHDVLIMRGRITSPFAMRFGDFRVAANDLVVDNVFPGARFDADTQDSASIDISGITVLGKWYVFHSNSKATKPLLTTVRDAPYIAFVAVYQVIGGTQPDRFRFVGCTIGRVGRDADFAGEPRQWLQFERCTIGIGVSSGKLTDTYGPTDLNAEYVDCVFRLFGTATLGSTTQYNKNRFINCRVEAADGTVTTLDNRPTTALFNFQPVDPIQEPGVVKQWVSPSGEVRIQGPSGLAQVIATVGI